MTVSQEVLTTVILQIIESHHLFLEYLIFSEYVTLKTIMLNRSVHYSLTTPLKLSKDGTQNSQNNLQKNKAEESTLPNFKPYSKLQ